MPWSLVVIGFLLSSASFCVAYERAPNKQMDKLIGGNTEQTPMPKKRTNRPLLTSQSILFGNCTSGKKQPILPPSFTQTVNLLSVRSRMLFQIFDDGTIAANGTVQTNQNAILIVEVVAPCTVRIRGAHNQRYLAMEEDGSLVTQTEPDLNSSIFRLNVANDFYTFKRNNYFVAFKRSGQLKKTDRNLKYHRKSTRFVLLLREQFQPPVYRPTLASRMTQRATSPS